MRWKYTKGKAPAKIVENETIHGFVTKFVSKQLPQYLIIGDECQELADILSFEAWMGVYVSSEFPKTEPPDTQTYIAGVVDADPKFVPTLDYFWVRSVTVMEIFNQFPGPYDLICLWGTGRDRELWQTEQIFNSLPKIYVLHDDDHNEQIVEIAKDRGYDRYSIESSLILVHQ